MTIGNAAIDEVVNDGGNVAFAFRFITVFRKELGEVIHEVGEKGNGEGPEVHRDDNVFIDEAGIAIEAPPFDLVVVLA